MSHFSTIKTQIRNREYLIEALKKLSYNVQVGNYSCRGYGGNTTPVEILIKLSNTDYNIGFRKSGDFYELVADWYGITGVQGDTLISSLQSEITKIENKIKQEYAYTTTLGKLRKKGFSIIKETREQGEIRIQLRRLA